MRIFKERVPSRSAPTPKAFARIASRNINIRRRVLLGLSIVMAIVLLVSTFLFWFVQRTLPQTTGTLTVQGLNQPVSVIRDQWGVPHITASNLHDVIFAQGYVTAQDRLFQMELSRRIAQGRLAELFGKDQIATDAFLRTLGIYRITQARLAHVDAQSFSILQAYADGVNAFTATHKNTLPLEFSVLGITPEPWTPTDSLAVSANLALSLDGTWYYKYTRALLIQKVGVSTTNVLFPAYPSENPTLISSSENRPITKSIPHTSPQNNVKNFTVLPSELLQGASSARALLGSINGSLGSNNWVVDGTKTVTGKPLLANDPHLDISVPSIWYETALQGGDLNAIGFSIAGVPGIIIGHNTSIAWGITNVEADNTDLYRETLDPLHHPGQYLYNKRWLPLTYRQETIRSRDTSTPYVITVASTLHGPLLNSVVNDLKGDAPLALKWTLLQPEYTVTGFFQLDLATNWTQFVAGLKNISISQNFVYADVQGNIGYRMSGLLPIRPYDNSLVPVDGSTSANEWKGYVPQADMPMLFNPPTHMIVTANNQIVPTHYPIYVTQYWDYGYRAQRIQSLLQAKPRLSSTDFERIQADVYSLPAEKITPYLISAGKNASGNAALGSTLLQGWNYTVGKDSSAAAVYEVIVSTLLREMLEPLLGKDTYMMYSANFSSSGLFALIINTFSKPTSPFFGITGTSKPDAARDATIAHAMSDAIGQLRTQFGPDTRQWNWGKIHEAHFDHPLSSVYPLNLVFGAQAIERPGDTETINIGGDDNFASYTPNYDQRTVSSMREIIDLANFDTSLWIITTGESGQPFSEHYNDLTALWDQNRYQSMKSSVDMRNAASTLQLLP